MFETSDSNKNHFVLYFYSWGDYGTPPESASFLTHALVMNHFWKCGGWYPVGGSSEIAYNIIPVIEKSGGQVPQQNAFTTAHFHIANPNCCTSIMKLILRAIS